jgi:hypothetical protein
MLKGKMEFRLGSEQRVCGPGDVVVIPAGSEHEGWFREDSEMIDFFAPPRNDFLLGGKPACMSEGLTRSATKAAIAERQKFSALLNAPRGSNLTRRDRGSPCRTLLARADEVIE